MRRLKEALDAVKKNDKGKNHEETEGAGEIYTPSGQPMAWVSASQTGGAPTMVTPSGYQLGMGPLPQFQSPLGGSMHHTLVIGGGPAGHMGAGSSTHFQMHTGGQTQMPYGGFQSHPTMGIPGGGGAQPPAHGHFFNSMSRLSKIEFPRFNGVDLRSWIYKVDQFFSLDEIPPNQKVRVASLHFDGLAIEWHLCIAYIRSRQHLPHPTWDEYMFALMDRFGTEFEDPMAELKLVKQTGSVKDYHNEFDKIMIRLTILPEYVISGFITGLKHEIGYTVKNHRPFSLPKPTS